MLALVRFVVFRTQRRGDAEVFFVLNTDGTDCTNDLLGKCGGKGTNGGLPKKLLIKWEAAQRSLVCFLRSARVQE